MLDPHRFVAELSDSELEKLILRLEGRAQEEVFSELFKKYVSRLDLGSSRKALEVGCGTGVVLRQLAKAGGFNGSGIGVDHCEHFIQAAREFAAEEKVGDQLEFQVGDVHSLDFADDTFDLVIAHTLLSHVTDPAKVVAEISRVLSKGGEAVIFDGDYASLTYAFPDHSFGSKMDQALANNTFNNPKIVRDLPRLLSRFNLEMREAWGDAVVEIGRGAYFKSFAETYLPYVMEEGLFTSSAADIWLEEQHKAMREGTFFAACNYYTFILKRV